MARGRPRRCCRSITHLAKAENAEVDLMTVITPVAIWDAAASMIKWDAEEKAARGYIGPKP